MLQGECAKCGRHSWLYEDWVCRNCEKEPTDEVNAARGIINGLILSLPLWVIILWLISQLIR